MGKRVYGLRSLQKDDETQRKKKYEAEHTNVIVPNSKNLYDEKGRLIVPKGSGKKEGTRKRSGRMRKIKCTKCGKEKGISKRRLELNLKRFVDEAKLVKSYLCRDCRAKDKPAKPKKEKAPAKKEFKKTKTGKKTAEELFEEQRQKDPKKAAQIDKLAAQAEARVAANTEKSTQ